MPEKYSTPAGGMTARERAGLYALAIQEREDEGGEQGPLLVAKRARQADEAKKQGTGRGETCEKYFGRFLEHRKAIGRVRRVRDNQSSWSLWISPKLGAKLVAGINRDDVEDVRDALDAAVAKRKKDGGRAGLSGARARNVWSVLTSMMKEACSSKRRDLRVRDDNPCSTVQPPDRTDARVKTFINSTEFLRLVSCVAVPREWRELYAVACYLYLRPGELRVLRWTDVDFEAGVVHVTKAYDEDSKTVKAPKTRNGVRDVPMPATLVPLLEAMRVRAGDDSKAAVPLMAERNENLRSICAAPCHDTISTRSAAGFRTHPRRAAGSEPRSESVAQIASRNRARPSEAVDGARSRTPVRRRPPAAGSRRYRAVTGCDLRRGRDSNPRQAFDLRPLSKRVPSATRSPLPSTPGPGTYTKRPLGQARQAGPLRGSPPAVRERLVLGLRGALR